MAPSDAGPARRPAPKAEAGRRRRLARVAMEILGHSAIALTMNTYSHVAPEVSREAADRMVQMLWQHGDEDQADDANEREDG